MLSEAAGRGVPQARVWAAGVRKSGLEAAGSDGRLALVFIDKKPPRAAACVVVAPYAAWYPARLILRLRD